MKVTTSKAFRARYLSYYQFEDFTNFEDFFIYLHLNRNVQLLHAIGFIIGCLLFPWAAFSLLKLNLIPLLICNLFFYGMGFISHQIGDGTVSKTAAWPVLAFWYAVLLNIRFLAGSMPIYENRYKQKYPHTLWIYDQQSPQPPEHEQELPVIMKTAAKIPPLS